MRTARFPDASVCLEPASPLAGVRGVVISNGGYSGVQELYAASCARLVGVVGAVAGDQHEAEEAVQDAFVRLMASWSAVSQYDDPEAWVRHVALRLVSNRRRKAMNGIRAALRHGPPPDVPAPGVDRIDLDVALSALSPQQRAVIVLQRLGLDVDSIAQALSSRSEL